jgi:short-subunit dehydrogenase
MNQCPVALVSGGSSGIGAACVRKFLALNWAVSVVALADSELDQIQEAGAFATPGDITSREAREKAVERTLQRYGRIDLLVNSAGVGLYAPPTEIPIPEFSRVLDVNVLAPLALTQLVIPHMKHQGSGAIVNIGSVAGLVALPWAAAYSASKFALDAVHDSLRRELRRSSIQVLKVCPGIVATKFRDRALVGEAPPAVKNIRWVVSPETVAARILLALKTRRHTIFVPRIGRLFALSEALIPSLLDIYLSRYLTDHSLIGPVRKDSKDEELAFSNTSSIVEE